MMLSLRIWVRQFKNTKVKSNPSPPNGGVTSFIGFTTVDYEVIADSTLKEVKILDEL